MREKPKKKNNVKRDAKEAERDASVKSLVLTLNDDALAAAKAAQECGLAQEVAEAAVRAARRAVSARSRVDREAFAGENVERLHAIYATAIETGDVKTALAAQKELSRTLRLNEAIVDRDATSVDAEKEETRRILQSAVNGEIERLDDLARAVVHRLIEAETGARKRDVS